MSWSALSFRLRLFSLHIICSASQGISPLTTAERVLSIDGPLNDRTHDESHSGHSDEHCVQYYSNCHNIIIWYQQLTTKYIIPAPRPLHTPLHYMNNNLAAMWRTHHLIFHPRQKTALSFITVLLLTVGSLSYFRVKNEPQTHRRLDNWLSTDPKSTMSRTNPSQDNLELSLVGDPNSAVWQNEFKTSHGHVQEQLLGQNSAALQALGGTLHIFFLNISIDK